MRRGTHKLLLNFRQAEKAGETTWEIDNGNGRFRLVFPYQTLY